MRVLLLEQAPFLAAILQHALKKQGHEVVAAKKVLQLQPLVLLTHDWQAAQSGGSFDVALVDGLQSEQLTGPVIVRALTESGVPCFGIAAVPGANEPLCAAGAVGAAKKSTVLAALYCRMVTPEDLCLERRSQGMIAAKMAGAMLIEKQHQCREMRHLHRLIARSIALHPNLDAA